MSKLKVRLAVCILLSVLTMCTWGACGDCICQDTENQNQKLTTFLKDYKNRNNPDAVAAQYAIQKNISFEDAKKELRKKFGNPKKPDGLLAKLNCNPYGLTPEEQELLENGVPLNLILKRDDDFIMKYILENKITTYTEKLNL